MKTEEEIRSLLLEFVKKGEYYKPLYDRYTEIKIIDDKIYFPDYVYHGCDAKPEELVLQSYKSTSYTPLYPIEKVVYFLRENGVDMMPARQGDVVYCGCGSKHFTFTYGGYRLNVKCKEAQILK